MDVKRLVADWKREEAEPFEGWSFPHLEGRLLEDRPPWSYLERVAELMRGASSVLDIDTGGGERLLSLREAWPAKVVATEGWPPNVKLARERLGPFGAEVADVTDTNEADLPFGDGEFDLVINRHGGFKPSEVSRVLAPGGTFLTQQVGAAHGADLIEVFGAELSWPDARAEYYLPRLEAAGLTILAAENWSGRLAYTDVGAIVYHFMAVPWFVPGFSVDTHLPQLLELQARLARGEGLEFTARSYLIEARK